MIVFHEKQATTPSAWIVRRLKCHALRPKSKHFGLAGKIISLRRRNYPEPCAARRKRRSTLTPPSR